MKRLHVHVGVEDLDRSISFYSILFGAAPDVVKPDYARWMIDDPRVNFAISEGRHAGRGIEHLGIQAGSAGELADVYGRLAAAGGRRSRKARPFAATPGRKRAGSPIPTASSGKPSSPMATPPSTAIRRLWPLCRPMPRKAIAAPPLSRSRRKRRAAAAEKEGQ